MPENVLRHLIALCGTLIALILYGAGYVSGSHGWWLAIFGVIIMYYFILKFLDVNAHH